eukprot:scaffold89814_cov37-Phaeocystis_antarctica.AAC.1
MSVSESGSGSRDRARVRGQAHLVDEHLARGVAHDKQLAGRRRLGALLVARGRRDGLLAAEHLPEDGLLLALLED